MPAPKFMKSSLGKLHVRLEPGDTWAMKCSHCGKQFRQGETLFDFGKYTFHRVCVRLILHGSYVFMPATQIERLSVDDNGLPAVLTEGQLFELYRAELAERYEEVKSDG